jgi:hypothetical protein
MEITGKLVEILPEQSGTSQRGEWKKQEFIIETLDQYPKKVCIVNWGDKVDLSSLNNGEEITVHVNVESREFKGRWYTDIKAWKIDKKSNEVPGSPPPPSPEDEPVPPDDAWSNDGNESPSDDLPF